MAKHFVIMTQPMKPEHEKELQAFLGNGVHWWHWFTNVWLVIDPNDKLHTAEIRNRLMELDRQVLSAVFEVEPKGWSAFLDNMPNGVNKADWLENLWFKTHPR